MKPRSLMIKLSHLGHLWRNGRWHGLRNDINIQNQETLWLLAECNVWKMAQRNKLNRKVCARLCRAFFEGSSTLPVRQEPAPGSVYYCWINKVEQHGLWRKSFLLAVSFTAFSSPYSFHPK